MIITGNGNKANNYKFAQYLMCAKLAKSVNFGFAQYLIYTKSKN